jgi:hypothetical protein
MIDLYYWTTPNGHKIMIFLEEAAIAYRIVPVNISKGEQFKPEFLAISPTIASQRSLITIRRTEGSQFPYSNRAPSCCTSARRPASTCRQDSATASR